MKLKKIQDFTAHCAGSFVFNLNPELITSADLQYKQAEMTRVMLMQSMRSVAQSLIQSGAESQFQKTVEIYMQIPVRELSHYLLTHGSCFWDYWMISLGTTLDKDTPEEQGVCKSALDTYRRRYAGRSIALTIDNFNQSLRTKIEGIGLQDTPLDDKEADIQRSLHAFRVAAVLTLYMVQDGYEEQFPDLVDGLVSDVKAFLEKAILECIQGVHDANLQFKKVSNQTKPKGFG